MEHPYIADAQGKYPDVTITNNFFPFLFNNIKYKIDTNEVEVLDTPGIFTTANSLLTYQKAFNGLDMGWVLDSGDGAITTRTKRVYYNNPGFGDGEIMLADIAQANYQALSIYIGQRIIDYNLL